MDNNSAITNTILNRIQISVPLTPRPYYVLAEELGISEEKLLDEIIRLRSEDIIRNISGIFNAAPLGYQSTLVAFEVKNPDAAASVINAHPGVSHNYLRNHRYNIWFTLSVPPEHNLQTTAQTIAQSADAVDYILLSTKKLYKIGVHFHIGDSAEEIVSPTTSHYSNSSPRSLSIAEKEAVRLLQFDLPTEPAPFRAIIEQHNGKINETILLDIAHSFLQRGIMRRYAAVLRHHKAGYSTNSMTAWKPEGLSDDAIETIFAHERSISHLYLREITPGKWEYPLFAMIHAKTDEALHATIEKISSASGIKDFLVLKSLKEFKKERVMYFSEEFENWKALND
jgi:DNA-binding Lrp family transcriptional regulator